MLNDLKRGRAIKKSCISRINTKIDKEKLSVNDLACRLKMLEQYFAEYLPLQDSIDKLTTQDAAEDDANENYRETIEDLYCMIKSKILTLLDRIPKSPVAPSVQSTCDDLPKTKPPTFSGEYTQFHTFIQQFKATVDAKPIPTIRKFQLLMDECLKGNAKLSVQSLDVTEANYHKALEILQDRYDNKCIVFQTHIRELYNIPAVPKNSGVHLRRFVDDVDGHLAALRSLGSDTDIVNALLIHIASIKLDVDTYTKWEESFDLRKLPSWTTCSAFLNKRSQHLDVREPQSRTSSTKNHDVKFKHRAATTLAVSEQRCAFCNNVGHKIANCIKFAELSVYHRFRNVKRMGLCINCLNHGHSVRDCNSSKCKVCKESHHSILHRFQSTATAFKSTPSTSTEEAATVAKPFTPITSSALHSGYAQGPTSSYIFLATAVVNARGTNGELVPIRILLDSGSQLNLVSERMAQRLCLKRKNFNGELSAVGNVNIPARHKTSASISSRIEKFEVNLDFWILPSITSNQPDIGIDVSDWRIPTEVGLADPHFNKPQRIDMLLGADIFFDLMSEGQIKLGEELPLLKNTLLGWIVVGKYKSNEIFDKGTHSYTHVSTLNPKADVSLNKMLETFLAIEEVTSNVPNWTEEQIACENAFIKSIRQGPDGRFIVKLPFKRDPNTLGDSRKIAEKRFLHLEKQLEKHPEIKKQYISFMQEYESMGHMKPIALQDVADVRYYMPHHFVLRPESSTTRLRVVFDASCRTTSNVSLNEILMVGPTVQNDLFSISLRFRSHKIALTADINKMYRQIFVQDADSNFQCILWRESPAQEIRAYRLLTVTYGTSSAPYHATRCLLYLAEKHQKEFPLASEIIKNDFYVDDLISGAESLEEAERIRSEVESVLHGAGLQLRKWSSNDPLLMNKIPASEHEKLLRINGNDVIKALGIVWQPSTDELQFIDPLENVKNCNRITKRSILADVARLFDPLGLVNPVIVVGKMFLQRLWLVKVEWDEEIDDDLKKEWVKFRSQLCKLSEVRVPRYVFAQDRVRCELHGFSDASLKAFGCCIYVRVENSVGNISVHLLCAKSKVAPISTQSLPRLELCAALLLSKLLRQVLESFGLAFDQIFLWTDSEIVLDWIADHPSSWNTFVANRVAIIHQLTANTTWRHVNTKSNPADIVSRGSLVEDLMSSIWFTGPLFLYHHPTEWPAKTKPSLKNNLERRKPSTVLLGASSIPMVNSRVEDIIENHKHVNNYKKLIRIFAYCHRFIENIKRRQKNSELLLGEIQSEEYQAALLRVIFVVQRSTFKEDIVNLESKNNCVDRRSRLRKLNPFIQSDSLVSLIRVGGRLEHSDLPYEGKHPILLPKSHPFTESFIRFLHWKYHHAGAQALVSISRQTVWIVDVRSVATKVVHDCLRCFRMRPRLREQIMGDLPSSRVSCTRPFLVSGVDFCGPFSTTLKTRGCRTTKSYMAVFVCFSTKAVHLEIVSDLTTNGFMAALRRFIARRGICRHLYCDNATNFVGARNELADLKQKFYSQTTQSSMSRVCAEDGIEFHHIPPRSPHFGGLWESAVKSAKSLLIRSCSPFSFTFEELATVAAEIEAILNSRPLTPLTSDPNDEQVLTPGHFLIGTSLTSFEEPDITKISRLNRWQQLTSIRQHFWKRWSREYLSQLQYRHKWNTTSADIQPGTMVLVSDDNLPPLKWLLGRIVDIVRGKDGHVRVVAIKTKSGELTRAVQKVAPLPFECST